MIRRQVDSAGASRWVRRAEALAKSIKADTGSAREINDGYLVEGRRNKRHRMARIIDLPGRFLPYGHPAINVQDLAPTPESAYPRWAAAPTRRLMLERLLGEDGAQTEFGVGIPDETSLSGSFFGRPPPASWRSIGISNPQPSPDWMVQTRTIYPSTDPRPVMERAVRPYRMPSSGGLDLDYSSVSNLWLMIDAWGVGTTERITLFVDEEVIRDLLDVQIIRKETAAYIGTNDTRAWATVVSKYMVVAAVWLSDDDDFAGEACSLGLLMFQRGEDGWVISMAERILHDDMPHPLFQPHYRVYAPGEPVVPPMRSRLYPWVTALASDGHKAYFTTTLRHEMDGSYTRAGGLPMSERVVATCVFRAEVDLETHAIDIGIDNVCADSLLEIDDIPLAGNLITSNGLIVSQHLDSDWAEPDWPAYCGMVFDGSALYEVVGLALGTREPMTGTGVTSTDQLGGSHRYREGLYRFDIAKIEWVESEEDDEPRRVISRYSVTTSTVALQPHAYVGTIIQPVIFRSPALTPPLPGNVLDGGALRNRRAPSHIGRDTLELPMFQAGSNRWVIGRINIASGSVTQAPLPAGAGFPVSTCYAQERETEDSIIPHRSLVSYTLGGQTVVEVRSGDQVIATASTDVDCEMGIFYMGNPFSNTRHGLMEALQ